MNNNHYLIIVIILVIIFVYKYFFELTEHLDTISNESIQNIGKIYNDSNLVTSNINVTGNLSVVGSTSSTNIITTGDTKIGGALDVSGPLNANGNVTLTGTTTNKGVIYINGPSGVDPALKIGATNALNILMNANAGAYNPIVSQGDNVIWVDTANLDIVPWSNKSGGLKIKNDGTVTAYNTLYTNGISGIVKQLKGVQATDGWDLKDFSSSSESDCINQCIANPAALTAQYRLSDKRCWCKSVHGTKSVNSGYNTTFFY